jgi:hypothetical protein
MSSRTPASPLSGTLQQVPFLGDDPATRIAPIYADLVDEHAVSDVLVLKRFPTGIDTFTDRVARETEGIERPRVDAVGGHARSLLEASDDSPQILGDTERSELAHQYLQDANWDTPYLAGKDEDELIPVEIHNLGSIGIGDSHRRVCAIYGIDQPALPGDVGDWSPSKHFPTYLNSAFVTTSSPADPPHLLARNASAYCMFYLLEPAAGGHTQNKEGACQATLSLYGI